jgi:hypothetical protein
MFTGKMMSAQIADFLPLHPFCRCAGRKPSAYPGKTFSHLDQFLCRAFEACLSTFSKQVQLGEVGERVGEAIDRIDHHYGDPGGPNIGQEVLQGRAIDGGTREPAIVVAIRNQAPALMRLALDRGLAGLALGIARVEGEIEIALGRFAGVDRAAEDFSFGGRRRCAFAWSSRHGRHADANGPHRESEPGSLPVDARYPSND